MSPRFGIARRTALPVHDAVGREVGTQPVPGIRPRRGARHQQQCAQGGGVPAGAAPTAVAHVVAFPCAGPRRGRGAAADRLPAGVRPWSRGPRRPHRGRLRRRVRRARRHQPLAAHRRGRRGHQRRARLRRRARRRAHRLPVRALRLQRRARGPAVRRAAHRRPGLDDAGVAVGRGCPPAGDRTPRAGARRGVGAHRGRPVPRPAAGGAARLAVGAPVTAPARPRHRAADQLRRLAARVARPVLRDAAGGRATVRTARRSRCTCGCGSAGRWRRCSTSTCAASAAWGFVAMGAVAIPLVRRLVRQEIVRRGDRPG